MRMAQVEQALLLLPLDVAKALLIRLLPTLPSVLPVQLVARCVLFLLAVSFSPPGYLPIHPADTRFGTASHRCTTTNSF